MCNGGYCKHRFSVKDIAACSSKLQFVFWDRDIGFVKCRDLLVPILDDSRERCDIVLNVPC
jgi:hypothetical protein